jgi:hypothetical protein
MFIIIIIILIKDKRKADLENHLNWVKQLNIQISYIQIYLLQTLAYKMLPSQRNKEIQE